MLKWAFIFLLVSIISGAMGFSGISAGTAAMAKVLFFIALSLFVLFLIAALVVKEKVLGK